MEHLLELLPDYLTGHLQLTLLALLAATLLSVPLGIVASRTPRMQALVLGFAGVVQTIPSLALLAAMVPAAWGAAAIGAFAAVPTGGHSKAAQGAEFAPFRRVGARA